MNENEYRVQDEYFAIEENWPQPKDNKVTLEQEGYMGETPTKKKPAMTAKKKRKLSESLAGMTAAAVAVIMVSTSMPGLKDMKDDFVKPSVGEPCPVCGSAYCEFWDSNDGRAGLRLSFDGEHTDDPFDFYAMNGFTDEDDWDTERVIYIGPDNETRAVLRFNFQELCGENHTHSRQRYRFDGQDEIVYTGREVTFRDNKSGEETGGGYVVQLLYAPDGNLPERGYEVSEDMMERLGPNYDYCAVPITEDGHLELRFYTNQGIAFCEKGVSLCQVEIIERMNSGHPLGETMTFMEDWDGGMVRTWEDDFHASCTSYTGFHTDHGEEEKFFRFDGDHKSYGLCDSYGDNMEICFIEDDWHKLMSQWMELNEEARETGHEVCYEVKKLEEIEVNDINYTAYFVWTTGPVDDVNNYQWITTFYVPMQEPNIAIVMRESMEPERIEEVLNWKGIGGMDYNLPVLEQFYLNIDAGVGGLGSDDNQQQASSVCTVCGETTCSFYLWQNQTGYRGLRVSMLADIAERAHNLTALQGLTTEDTDASSRWTSYSALHGAFGERVMLRINLARVPEYERYEKLHSSNIIDEQLMAAEEDVYSGYRISLYDSKSMERGNIVALLVYGHGGVMPGMDFGLPANLSLGQLEYRVYPIEGVENVELRVYSDMVGAGLAAMALDYCETEILVGDTNRLELGYSMYLNEDAEAGVLRTWADWAQVYAYETWLQGVMSETLAAETIAFYQINTPMKVYGVLSDGRKVQVACLEDSWITYFRNWTNLNREAVETGHEVFFNLEKVGELNWGNIIYDAYLAWNEDETGETYDVTRFFIPRQEARIALIVHETAWAYGLQDLLAPDSLQRLDSGLRLLFDHIELQ